MHSHHGLSEPTLAKEITSAIRALLHSKQPLRRRKSGMSGLLRTPQLHFRCSAIRKQVRVQKALAFYHIDTGKSGKIRESSGNIEKGAPVRTLGRAEYQSELARACKVKRVDDKKAK